LAIGVVKVRVPLRIANTVHEFMLGSTPTTMAMFQQHGQPGS
jgi:hypothetical protein